MGASAGPRPPWTFLTSHARVLVTLYRDPGARLRDVAATCALTERTVQTIVADLEEAGYLRRVREGRRNHYRITPGTAFHHPAEAGHGVAGFLALFAEPPGPGEVPKVSAGRARGSSSLPPRGGGSPRPSPAG